MCHYALADTIKPPHWLTHSPIRNPPDGGLAISRSKHDRTTHPPKAKHVAHNILASPFLYLHLRLVLRTTQQKLINLVHHQQQFYQSPIQPISSRHLNRPLHHDRSIVKHQFPLPVLTALSNEQPTPQTLLLLHQELNTTAISLPSVRGDGELGHFALVVPAADYLAASTNIPFVPPVRPGVAPIILPNATAAVIT